MKVRVRDTTDEVEVGQYKAVDKGALRAFFTLIIYPSAQKIIDCRYFEKDGQRWFSFPQKEIKKLDGEKSDYIPLISYLNKEYLDQLKVAILAALKEVNPQESNGKAKVQADSRPAYQVRPSSSFDREECPF